TIGQLLSMRRAPHRRQLRALAASEEYRATGGERSARRRRAGAAMARSAAGAGCAGGMRCQRCIRRRNVNAATLVSTKLAISNPHGVNVGASAAVLAQVPTWPARLQRIDGSVHPVSQQTLSTQKPVEQAGPVLHAPPWGTPVLVGVTVG